MRRLIKFLAGLFLFLDLATCGAQEGNFDTTWGNDGRLLVGVSVLGTADSPSRLILRPNNKLLMSGTCAYTDPQDADKTHPTFCATQLLADGSYDGNFGPGGVGYVQLNRFSGWPTSTTLVDTIVLPDNRVVLLGNLGDVQNGADASFVIAVLLSDGSALDSSIGGGKGYLQMQFGGQASTANALVRQSDGKIVVVGAATGVNGSPDFAAARFLSDLSGFDSLFGTAGSQIIAFDLGGPSGDNTDSCVAVRLQSNGKIVMAGYSVTSPANQTISGAQISLTRLNTDGTRDLTFGTTGDGRLHYLAGEGAAVSSDVQIDGSDRIVLGGAGAASIGASTADWIVDRLSRDGARDATFNQGNPQTFSQPPGDGGAVTRIALTNDGIFGIGETARTTGSSSNYFAVARLNIDGLLDPRFGNMGRAYGSFTATNDFNTMGVGIAIGNGGIMVVGNQQQTATDGPTSKFGIGRLQYDQIFSYGFD